MTALNYDYVRISYDFTASSNEGFESYAISYNTNSGVYLSGCDGGRFIYPSKNQVGINDVEQVSESFKTIVYSLRPLPWQPILSTDS